MTVKKKMQAAARQVDAAAKTMLADTKKTWPGDKEMLKMANADAADLRMIATWLRECKPTWALDTASHMDTAARDMIPEAAWNIINE